MKYIPYWLAFIFLMGAAFILFIIYDTPMSPEAPKVTVSPSYWHWLDATSPREDTAHYMTYEEYQSQNSK